LRGCDGLDQSSQWAIRHPALISFLIFAIGVGGALSYFSSDAPKTRPSPIKNVNVARTGRPTTQEMQDQVTDRIEKKLREPPISTSRPPIPARLHLDRH